MLIHYHMPSFVNDGESPAASPAEFNTLEELLALPRIQRLRMLDGAEFSLSKSGVDWLRTLLMATMPDGSYWVVGYLDKEIQLDLPEWRKPK